MDGRFKNKICAFTLAEVLITLGIIGIVAALVIPNVIMQYKKKQTVTQLKTTYSILTQVIALSVNENGPTSTWDFNIRDVDFAERYILPYLKVSEKVTADNGSYWAVQTLMPNGYPYLTWPSGKNKLNANPIYILPNGSAINVARFLDFQTEIVIDVNGPKGPNVLGVDGFVFYISTKSNRILPKGYGLNRDDILLGKNKVAPSYACSRDINRGSYYQGSYCAAVIMEDNWEIKEDYPWGGGRKP